MLNVCNNCSCDITNVVTTSPERYKVECAMCGNSTYTFTTVDLATLGWNSKNKLTSEKIVELFEWEQWQEGNEE